MALSPHIRLFPYRLLNLKRYSFRFRFFFAAAILCLFILCASVTTFWILMKASDYKTKRDSEKEENMVENELSTMLRDAIIEALEATAFLEGYILSHIKKLPRIDAPPAERIQGQDFPHLNSVANWVTKNLENVVLQIVAPGGAIMFTHPENRTLREVDMFSPDYHKNVFGPSARDTMLLYRPTYNGPSLTILPTGARLWTVQICRPVYNATGKASLDSMVDNFWGFVAIDLNVSSIIHASNIDERMKKNNMDYVIYSMDSRNKNVVIISSLGNITSAELDEFIKTSTGNLPLLDDFSFALAVKLRRVKVILTDANITIIVSSMLFICTIIFIILSAFIIYYTQRYDGSKYAPKLGPFVVLTLGPSNSEMLWGLSPKEMDTMTKKLQKILDRNVQATHAYPISQLQPYSHSYVFRKASGAVHMAFSVMGELQRHPIDQTMERLFGEEGRLLMAYAVHWCVDASVRPSPYKGGGFEYEGPDVVYAGQLWTFAVPNVVTLSKEAKDALEKTNVDLLTVDFNYEAEGTKLRGPFYLISRITLRDSWLVFVSHSLIRECIQKMKSIAVNKEENASRLQFPDPSLPQRPPELSAVFKEEGVSRGTSGLDTRRPVSESSFQNSVEMYKPSENSKLVGDEMNFMHPFYPSQHQQDASGLNTSVGRTNRDLFVPYGELSSEGAQKRKQNFPHTPAQRDIQSPYNIRIDLHVSNPNVSISSNNNIHPPLASLRNSDLMITTYENDGVCRLLLHPHIPEWQDAALRAAFENQAVTMQIQFKNVRLITYYFFSCYKLLFRPLPGAERMNIFKRLVTVFGVPEHRILENLAARCVLRYIKNPKKKKARLPARYRGQDKNEERHT